MFITPGQIVFAIVISFVLTLITLYHRREKEKQVKSVVATFLHSILMPAVTDLAGQTIKDGLNVVSVILKQHEGYVKWKIMELPNYDMVLVTVKPKKLVGGPSVKIAIMYDSSDGEYKIKGHALVTPMEEAVAEKTVVDTYRTLIRRGTYDEISHIVGSKGRTGYVAIMDELKLSVGAISKDDENACITMLMDKEYELRKDAINFLFGGNVLRF